MHAGDCTRFGVGVRLYSDSGFSNYVALFSQAPNCLLPLVGAKTYVSARVKDRRVQLVSVVVGHVECKFCEQIGNALVSVSAEKKVLQCVVKTTE